MSIVITSGVKLENIQNGVVLGRKWEAGQLRASKKNRAVREFSRMREIRTVREIGPALLASCTGFLHFYLPNFEGDQPGSFMHGLTRQNWYQMPVKTTKIAT